MNLIFGAIRRNRVVPMLALKSHAYKSTASGLQEPPDIRSLTARRFNVNQRISICHEKDAKLLEANKEEAAGLRSRVPKLHFTIQRLKQA